MKYSIVTFFLLIIQTALCNAQPGDAPKDAKPGSCYAKCLINDYGILESQTNFPVFVGEDATGILLDTIEIKSKKSSVKWMKKQKDRNCLSIDPEDCLMWCMVEIHERVDSIIVVVDTSAKDEYAWETFDTSKSIIKGNHTEWREIVCGQEIEDNFINNLAAALDKNGYSVEDWQESNVFTPELKAKLQEFQRANRLPIGALDMETLEHLELR
jgi:Putative peptidoglycan binding domain